MIKRSLFVLLLIGAATVAQAQSIEVTPFFGYRGGGEINSDTLNPYGDVEIDDSASYGLIIGFPISPWALIELEADFQNSDLVQKGGDFLPGSKIGEIDVNYYHVGFVFQSPGPRIQGFGVFTLGASLIDPNLEGLTSETKFSTSFGGGIKLNFNQNLGLRLEGRGFYTLLDSNNDYNCCYYWSEDLWQGEARVGLIVKF